MRFFITLALIMLPMTAMQLYSADSFAFTNKSVQQKSLSDQAISSKRHAPVSADKTLSIKSSATQDGNKLAKAKVNRKPRKERTKRNRKSAQGMQLLSMLLMLQDKKQ